MTQEKHTSPAGARNAQHTPGPWTQNADTVWRGKHETVCHPLNHPQSIADARLIAAAPDLLEALKALIPFIEMGFAAEENPYGVDHNSAVDALSAANAAIAKATL